MRMLTIVEDFIPRGRRNRPGLQLDGPRYITIHDTGNPHPGADALAHARYLKGDAAARRPASWHFTVDDQRAVQHLPLDEVGWHAGDGREGPGNRSSLAIEICQNADGDRARAEANAAELVADLLRRYDLDVDRVVQHHRWSSKNCPAVLRGRPGGWEGFLGAIRRHLDVDLTPIMGQARATLAQAREWLHRRAPEWTPMADLYWSIAPGYGVRADVALAQACKETGFFRFGGLVKPEQNNFCGLGATGPGHPGASFRDRATGVGAHVQHLYAYATEDPLPDGAAKVDPRFDLVKRGSAPYVEWLGAAENPTGVGWAYPGKGYGRSIVRDYLSDLLATEEPEPPEVDWKARALAAEKRAEKAEKALEALTAGIGELISRYASE